MGAVLRLMAGNPKDGGSSFLGASRGRPGNGPRPLSTVLVVEDEVLIRAGICDFLRRSYRVLEAANAAEAQAVLAAGEPIEIVVSDINMPGGVDGFALAEWTRRHYPDVKVILTSGVKTAAEAAAGGGEGHFLTKPYAYDELAAYIKKLLGPGS